MEQEHATWGVIRPTEIKFVTKRWGYERHMVNNEKFCGKELFIASGRYTSFHWHEIKEEMLYVQEGILGIVWADDRGRTDEDGTAPRHWDKIYSGGGFYVVPNIIHQLCAIQGDLTLIETSTQHFDKDSYRITTDLMFDFNFEDDGK